ncbi:hypothetical protein ERW49_08410 [Aliivibrio finisterrensis]|uniref:Uncharacterized protein n=1 Tax=Aliivibrio finisterrensis TaxID=511998 RepID=A0A4Q5KML8_9GAMM|nr:MULTISPECIES: hypothetical protein [Aliivibrio]MDD9175498.1 hypothetical protein [Aliivibrio sp. S3TY1]MDD9192577.1 hypothetical protein [Aliivibrio sp. S2TY2]MDD9200336.1 hypothetical protein [Aliivibrio sp. S2MY1]RYU46615.1 hypothetical protein ERW49_08410 [Aliivibrio finisterrensis]
MELSEYIEISIYSVLKGLKNADDKLSKDKLGSVWTDDFNTISSDLVNLKLAKGQKDNSDKSVPVLVFDFDINVEVGSEKNKDSSSNLSTNAKILNVISFGGGINAGSSSKKNQVSTQNLKFSVPVSFEIK